MHSDLEEHFIALSFSQGSLSSKYFESFQMHIKIQPFAMNESGSHIFKKM